MLPDNLHILVVEDNPGDFFLVREYLREYHPHFNIVQAVTLAEARLLVKKVAVDLILLDLSLPDSSGMESIKEMISFAENIPVIVLTGFANKNFGIDTLGLGVQDYLIKGEINGSMLEKSISYSFERKKYIEDLKISNDRYSYVSKATSDAIWDWDLVSNEIYYNISYYRLFGYPYNGESQPISSWKKLIHPEDVDRVSISIEEKLSAPGADNTWKEEYRYLKADGSYAYVFDRAYIVYDAHGTPVRMVGAMQDITREKEEEAIRIQEELERQKEILQTIIRTQEKERYHFGRELHDNIIQILAVCQIYLDMVLKGEAQPDFLKKSHDNVQLAIREIRTLSHQLAPATFSEHSLIAAVNEMVEHISASGKYQVHFNYAGLRTEEVPEEVKLTLFRVIQEQVNNILKHADGNEIYISIAQQPGDKIRLLVRDNGKGIKPGGATSGIGLSNIRNRISLYNGKMDLRSAPGAGCELDVVLEY